MSDALILPRAVLFDMDGTLTEPMLDFPLIKQEMGIGTRPILEALSELTGQRRAEAEAVLHCHEDRAAEHSSLNPGCNELLAWLDQHGIGSAVITRNRRKSATTVMKKHRLAIEVLVTREDGPFKPDPRPLLTAIGRLAHKHPGLKPYETWMVGDGQYDIESAAAAGVPSVWIAHGRQREFAAQPWRQVNDLRELLALLQSCTAASTNPAARGGS